MHFNQRKCNIIPRQVFKFKKNSQPHPRKNTEISTIISDILLNLLLLDNSRKNEILFKWEEPRMQQNFLFTDRYRLKITTESRNVLLLRLFQSFIFFTMISNVECISGTHKCCSVMCSFFPLLNGQFYRIKILTKLFYTKQI